MYSLMYIFLYFSKKKKCIYIFILFLRLRKQNIPCSEFYNNYMCVCIHKFNMHTSRILCTNSTIW